MNKRETFEGPPIKIDFMEERDLDRCIELLGKNYLENFKNHFDATSQEIEAFSKKAQEHTEGLRTKLANIAQRTKERGNAYTAPYFVARSGDLVVGFVQAGKSGTEARTERSIYSLFVDPEYRGAGTAMQLLEAVDKFFNHQGFVVWVEEDFPLALQTYERAAEHLRYELEAEEETGSEPLLPGMENSPMMAVKKYRFVPNPK